MAYVHKDPKKLPKKLAKARKQPARKPSKEQKSPELPKQPTGRLGRLAIWLIVSSLVFVLGVYIAFRIVVYLMDQPVVH